MGQTVYKNFVTRQPHSFIYTIIYDSHTKNFNKENMHMIIFYTKLLERQNWEK